MANKVISRFSVKMPCKKNEEKIRYELELIDDGLYKIYRYKYVSNKLKRVELRETAVNKVIVIDKWLAEIETLSYSI